MHFIYDTVITWEKTYMDECINILQKLCTDKMAKIPLFLPAYIEPKYAFCCAGKDFRTVISQSVADCIGISLV